MSDLYFLVLMLIPCILHNPITIGEEKNCKHAEIKVTESHNFVTESRDSVT